MFVGVKVKKFVVKKFSGSEDFLKFCIETLKKPSRFKNDVFFYMGTFMGKH